MQVHSRKIILRAAKIEFERWITDSRMILLVVLILFSYQSVTEPLLSMADKMNESLNMLEPFIALLNSPLLLLLIPMTFLTINSDFPRTEGNEIFSVSRIGRKEWLKAQILFVVLAEGLFLLILFFSTLLPQIAASKWSFSWSLPVRQYAYYFPQEAKSYAVTLITGRMYNQTDVVEAALMGAVLQWMNLTMLSLLMLLFWNLKRKKTGMFTAAGIMGGGTAAAMLEGKLEWLFPSAHTTIYLHYTKLLRKPIFPIYLSVVYFALLISVLLILNMVLIHKYDYLSNAQLN